MLGGGMRAGIELVDVIGIEPATPCLQSRQRENTKGFVWFRLREKSANFRSLKCPEVVPKRPTRRRLTMLRCSPISSFLSGGCYLTRCGAARLRNSREVTTFV